MSRTIENEALFYEKIRPLVTLEAPRGYHCDYDLTNGRSIHLLEDLVAAAFNAAVRKAEETSEAKMGKLTAGMPGMPPGMKLPF